MDLAWGAAGIDGGDSGNQHPATHRRALYELEGRVHEAVASFGTEVQTLGRENRLAPPDLREDVALLRDLLTSSPGAPEPRDEGFDSVMTVADAIALVALSPPAVGVMFRERSLGRLTGHLFQQAENMPLARFRAICSAWRGSSFEALIGWGRRMFAVSGGAGERPTEPPPDVVECGQTTVPSHFDLVSTRP